MSTPKTLWSVLPKGTAETTNLSWNEDVMRSLLEGRGTVLVRRVGTLIERGDLSPLTADATTMDHFRAKGTALMQKARLDAAAAADVVERIQRGDDAFTASPAEYTAGSTLASEIYRSEFARMRKDVVEDEMWNEVGLFVEAFEVSVAPEADMDLEAEYPAQMAMNF